ncbi:succinate dehydrogenase assembly factor 4 [Hypericibacter sp.]|uniref:succinate dehydrogenase assembly factor 4 n=1 Tax=Hypericibacter sp. TaxID=2705401 RepID=UPI003D6D27BD
MTQTSSTQAPGEPAVGPMPAAEKPKPAAPKTREIGGPKGPEPTRYGDWEVGGRCSDF